MTEKQIKALDNQFLELFIEESPDQRSSLHPTLQEAIAQYDQDFESDVPSSLKSQVA
ncbi:MAG: hypothetical protein HC840_31005 [Leptolyngbyaceae cyanobacterium RM2_2_4]|nr:hypothetical protein [Leptolyngbyaceae cyanobacterium SM1_4_3]NJO53092.1 hypothetical protein [Leptolyngbyaceae cyanobacterium RM2_2_4]